MESGVNRSPKKQKEYLIEVFNAILHLAIGLGHMKWDDAVELSARFSSSLKTRRENGKKKPKNRARRQAL